MNVDFSTSPLVSVIVPCHNAERWLHECLASVRVQSHRPLELSLWDDASTDGSVAVVHDALPALAAAGVSVVLGSSSSGDADVKSAGPLGCGAAKNRAVRQSSGSFLCFQDADDVMHECRVEMQLLLAVTGRGNLLVGSGVNREPQHAQPRYTAWLNGLSEAQLLLQRFRECTLAMPTWFCSRSVFDRVGGFLETGPGTPEDLDFFYRHLHVGGALARVPRPLVTYRSHMDQQSHGVGADSIWNLRLAEIQSSLLDGLQSFSIWSAGRDGKRLYRSLSQANQDKVVAFLDVAAGKLAAGCYYNRERQIHVPIVEWSLASDVRYQPSIICVKQGLHDGFEENLASLQLTEGAHYWHFC